MDLDARSPKRSCGDPGIPSILKPTNPTLKPYLFVARTSLACQASETLEA